LVLAEGRGAGSRQPRAEDLVERLLALAGVIADVSGAADVPAVAAIVTGRAADVLGADLSSLCLLDAPGTVVMVGRGGGSVPNEERWVRFPVADPNPISDAVRLQRFVAATNSAEADRLYPGVFHPSAGGRSFVVVPLVVRGRCLGAVAFAFPVDQDFDDLDRTYLQALADSVAQAVERIDANTAAAEAARRLGFLADASEVLARSLDYEDTLRAVADLAVPDLADWCSIELLEDGELRRVAVSHVDPEKVELAKRFREAYPPRMDAPVGAAAVARTGTPELYESLDAQLLDRLDLDEQSAGLVRELQLSSSVSVPLTARGRILGVLTLLYGESGRHYGPGDVAFAEDLARRAGMAIDNAQLHSETLEVSLQLQRAILPSTFEDTASWRVAVHYRPAGRSAVGGDFYDALVLPDQRMVAFVGDVMGRGVHAAAAMAQTRSALRAYLAIDPDPVAVVERLDGMFSMLDMPQFVTLAYVLVDPHAEEARLVTAGHLPPLLVRSGRAAELVAGEPSPPLGLASGRRSVTFPVTGDETIVLFTDGLVERRGEELEEGIRRLVELAPQLAGGLSDLALAGLADLLREGGHDDDVTILAIAPKARPASHPPATIRPSDSP
jgi:GAF domain-containing protein